MSNTKASLGERLRSDWIGYLNSRKYRIKSAWGGIIAAPIFIVEAVLKYARCGGNLDFEGWVTVLGGFAGLIMIVACTAELTLIYKTKPTDIETGTRALD